MAKRILSILAYQCIIWGLGALVYLDLKNRGVLSDNVWFTVILLALFIIAPIVYYVICAKVLHIEMDTFKHALAQIGFTILFDTVIAAIIICVELSRPRPSFFDFTGAVEAAFAIVNTFWFVLITIIIIVTNVIKKKSSPTVYKLVLAILGFIFVICPLLLQVWGAYGSMREEQKYEQEKEEEKQKLDELLRTKDAEIPYNTHCINSSGINGTEYKNDTVLIDYDTKTVGFLFSASYGRFYSFPLIEGSHAVDGYHIQKQWKLKVPGKELTTYYIDDDSSHFTIGIKLEMADHSVYSVGGLEADDGGCYLGLNTNTN